MSAIERGHRVVIDPSGPPRVGVFVCHCGVNIAGVVDVGQVVDAVRTLPGVVYASDELFACAEGSQRTIQEIIHEEKLNRVVVAACTPRTHEPVFRVACEEAGLNPYLLEMANIRDQCSWVHAADPVSATARAVDQVRMAVARARELEPLHPSRVDVVEHGLVIGGGAAGMACAVALGKTGVPVTLVESGDQVGGSLAAPGNDLPGGDGRTGRETLTHLRKLLDESSVEVLTGTRVTGVTGAVGDFEVSLNGAPETTRTLRVGAMAVAVGAGTYDPSGRFGYGELAGVCTSSDLSVRLADDDLRGAVTAVFVQCVGSRGDADQPWCSGVCCPTSVRQAIALREKGLDVAVLHRGIRAADRGLEEEYRRARDMGILFIRYDRESPPRVVGKKAATGVVVHDPLLRREIELPADLVVLAAGLVPREPDTSTLREILKTPKSPEGFIAEKHPELAPIETVVDGVMICGTIGGGADLAASISQGLGAASKMACLLGHSRLTLDAALAEVNAALCRGCGLCAEICDFHAPVLEPDANGEDKAHIVEAACKGCGTCAAFCPTGAIRARHFTDRQILAMVDAALIIPGGAS